MLKEIHRLRDYLRGWFMKTYPQNSKERRRWSVLTRCLVNIKEDGFIGGESGVSPKHLEREYAWLQMLERKMLLS